MRISSFIAILALSGLINSPLQAADAGKGQSTYALKGCIGCHGADGYSVVPMYPSMRGYSADFITVEMIRYRSGEREDPVMSAMAASLTDDDIANLAAYLGTLGSSGQDLVPDPTALRGIAEGEIPTDEESARRTRELNEAIEIEQDEVFEDELDASVDDLNE